MAFPSETDQYIKESIEDSLGLPVSIHTLRLKLTASEEHRRRLQDNVFDLEDRLRKMSQYVETLKASRWNNSASSEDETRHLREQVTVLKNSLHDITEKLEKSKAEAQMNANALKRIIEERQETRQGTHRYTRLPTGFSGLQKVTEQGNHAVVQQLQPDRLNMVAERFSHLKEELKEYKEELEQASSFCNVLTKENKEFRAQLRSSKATIKKLDSDVESLQTDRLDLWMKFQKAEDELKVLVEENNNVVPRKQLESGTASGKRMSSPRITFRGPTGNPMPPRKRHKGWNSSQDE